jgi:hypothetical protein
MKKTLSKFRKYRDTIAADGVRPITFREWYLGRLAGKVISSTAVMAQKRGDHATLNHALLAAWAGNQSQGGHLIGELKPWELSAAIKAGRVRIVIDEPAAATAAKG